MYVPCCYTVVITDVYFELFEILEQLLRFLMVQVITNIPAI